MIICKVDSSALPYSQHEQINANHAPFTPPAECVHPSSIQRHPRGRWHKPVVLESDWGKFMSLKVQLHPLLWIGDVSLLMADLMRIFLRVWTDIPRNMGTRMCWVEKCFFFCFLLKETRRILWRITCVHRIFVTAKFNCQVNNERAGENHMSYSKFSTDYMMLGAVRWSSSLQLLALRMERLPQEVYWCRPKGLFLTDHHDIHCDVYGHIFGQIVAWAMTFDVAIAWKSWWGRHFTCDFWTSRASPRMRPLQIVLFRLRSQVALGLPLYTRRHHVRIEYTSNDAKTTPLLLAI